MTDLPNVETPGALPGLGAAAASHATLVTLPMDQAELTKVPPMQLQPGDLLFTDAAAGQPGRVAIHMGNGSAIEATEGVVSFSVDEALAGQDGIMAWRRSDMTPEAAAAMIRWLRTQEGRPYPAVDTPSISTESAQSWICPDLVAAAFSHINLPLFDPNQVLPGQPVVLQVLAYVGHVQQGVSPAMTYHRPLGPFTPSESDRDAMIPSGSYGLTVDANTLEVGDLIVVSADAAVSEAIRQRTGQPASHIALYVGNGHVIEAIGSGVERRPLGTTLSETYYAAAYRYSGLSTAEKNQIRTFAEAEWRRGAEYDFLAIGSLQNLQDDDAWFCSELVFAAYESAGIHLGDAQRSTPGQVINLTGVEYLGHLPAQGDQSMSLSRRRTRTQSRNRGRSRAMDGPSLAALGFEILKGVVNGSAGDITYNFDQLRGKYSVHWNHWNAQQRLDHDAPSNPYTTVELQSRQSQWDLGTVSATIPISFDYNGHYISNLRLSRPATDEHFAYSMDLAGEISENRNFWVNAAGDSVSRVDLRITHVIDYDWLGESFYDDTAEIIERYEIYSDGSVWCTVVVQGTWWFDTSDAQAPTRIQNGALHIKGVHSAFYDALRRAAQSQSLSRARSMAAAGLPGGQSYYWESEPFRVHGTGSKPTQANDPNALVASVQGRGRGRAMSGDRVENAVQAAIRHGATEDEARAFFAHEAAVRRRGPRTLSGGNSFPEISMVDPDGWIAGIIGDVVEAAFPASANPLQILFDFCTNNNLSIGIGIVVSAGFWDSAGAGFGLVIAPGNRVGYYGSVSVGYGWHFEANAGVQLTVIDGGPSVFAGTSLVIGGSIDLSEGPSIGARLITDTSGNPIGWSAEVTWTIGVPAASAVEFTSLVQQTHARFVRVRTHGLSSGMSARGRMIGGLPLQSAPVGGLRAQNAAGWRRRAQQRPKSPRRIWA